ncbi:MAG: hypothetical protein EBS53_12700 [Bacteroidetes bacterium]|nr:hypothetical protein [Bacteroidota bacterium]
MEWKRVNRWPWTQAPGQFFRYLMCLLFVTFVLFGFCSCGVYRFSGASIPPEAVSLSIAQFDNRAAVVVPQLSQVLSDRMRDKFLAESRLRLQSSDADLSFEGSIVDYSVAPAAVAAGETTSLSRLSIAVQVRYTSRFRASDAWEQRFVRYADFDASLELRQVEDQLNQEIVRQLVDDIFNRAFVNW